MSDERPLILPLTPRARRIIEFYAHDEAAQLEFEFVGTEVLLLALFSDNLCLGQQVLVNLGLTRQVVRDEIIKLVIGSKGVNTMDEAKRPPSLPVRELTDQARGHIERGAAPPPSSPVAGVPTTPPMEFVPPLPPFMTPMPPMPPMTPTSPWKIGGTNC